MIEANTADTQPFFVIADVETGTIYCVHQEYSANDRQFLSRCDDNERILAIAMKANPACRTVKERLQVFPVMCSPTVNFSRYAVESGTGKLIERKSAKEALPADASAVQFD